MPLIVEKLTKINYLIEIPATITKAYPAVSDLAQELLSYEQPYEELQENKELLAKQITPLVSERGHLHAGTMLCAVTQIGKTLDFALEESKLHKQHLYILFIREQRIVPEEVVLSDEFLEDEEAREIVDYSKEKIGLNSFTFLFTVSDSPALNIAKIAQELKISRVILGLPRRHRFLRMVQGDLVQEVSNLLPAEIDVVIVS